MTLLYLIRRNTKVFFKDKGTFFTSLITPIVLLVLYVTFLANVYRDSFLSAVPEGFSLPDKLIDGFVGGQLFSSLMAACCVTVAFGSNMLMVQDKVTGARKDLTVSPAKYSSLALGYYISTVLSTLLVCFAAMGACLIYLYNVGWYMNAKDILFTAIDISLLVMFGTALSSVLNFFVSTHGQMSAIGAIVSAGYGFICGAYMPISQYSETLQKVISFLPGTYGTSLVRCHIMNGVFEEMQNIGVPEQMTDAVRDSIDCNIYFFGEIVSTGAKYLVLGGSILLLLLVYVILNVTAGKKAKNNM